MNKLLKEAEVIISKAEFEAKFPKTHMRRPIGDMQIKLCGYYTFLDPSNGKKTFVK